MIIALQPCFSGGIIHELSRENSIICTACRGFELGGWLGYFRVALKAFNDYEDDIREKVDISPKERKISILEAYYYTANMSVTDNQDFNPLIDDNAGTIRHHFLKRIIIMMKMIQILPQERVH